MDSVVEYYVIFYVFKGCLSQQGQMKKHSYDYNQEFKYAIWKPYEIFFFRCRILGQHNEHCTIDFGIHLNQIVIEGLINNSIFLISLE